MRTFTSRRTVGLLAGALAVMGLSLNGSANAAPVSLDLCATTGTVDLPGATGVPIWGFGQPATPGNCTTATAQLPGPPLQVNEGDQVTLHVTNTFTNRTLRFELPGISLDPGDVTAGPGQTLTVTFTASNPGVYLYESTGDAGRQTAMGLYGVLQVNSNTAKQAYDNPSTAYDSAQVLVLSQIDPAFNAAPDSYDLTQYNATYWMVNGKAYPDTLPGVPAPAGTRVLLRYVNAGYDNTTMALLGVHEHVVARDSRLVPQPFDAAAETIPAGGTEDAIVTMPTTAPPVAAGFPLYNRQLHLTNGPQTTPTPSPGGMLTFLHP